MNSHPTTSARDEDTVGLATGTPVAPFFGVEPPTGRRFEIMSIDILTVEAGKIVHVYHLEDWTSAIAQLTAAN